MIKVSVLYPNGVGAKFDIDYYCTQHMPMVQEKCGSSLKGVGVEQGLGADAPGAPPQFLARVQSRARIARNCVVSVARSVRAGACVNTFAPTSSESYRRHCRARSRATPVVR